MCRKMHYNTQTLNEEINDDNTHSSASAYFRFFFAAVVSSDSYANLGDAFARVDLRRGAVIVATSVCL